MRPSRTFVVTVEVTFTTALASEWRHAFNNVFENCNKLNMAKNFHAELMCGLCNPFETAVYDWLAQIVSRSLVMVVRAASTDVCCREGIDAKCADQKATSFSACVISIRRYN